MNIIFQNYEIMKDSLAFLTFFIYNFHLASNEKEKLKKMI